nr:MAG TPA: hypothetical protein [Caudoviricetes sp.]
MTVYSCFSMFIFVLFFSVQMPCFSMFINS